jgi:Fe-S-cluster-containing dehydrogenase component
MSMDRRMFLKIAGLTGVGLGLSAADIIVRNTASASMESLTVSAATTRLGIVIDVAKFKAPENYQKIIDACHSIHNVPTLIPEMNNPKNEVKWIWTDSYEHTFPEQVNDYIPQSIREQTYPMLCNHCDNPPCVRVCPTKATFKRDDGIVMQDPHRCIGCRFCMAGCPYGSRSFNYVHPRPYIKKLDTSYPTRTIGVVEKCTLCVERLARGLGPACVEASNGAMVFGNLADPESEIRQILNTKFTMRRKPALGTLPSVFYVIGGDNNVG